MAGENDPTAEESPERSRREGRWTKEREVPFGNDSIDETESGQPKGLKNVSALEDDKSYSNNRHYFKRFQNPNSFDKSSSIQKRTYEDPMHDDRSAVHARGRFNPRFSGGGRWDGGAQNRFNRRNNSYPMYRQRHNSSTNFGHDDENDRWVPADADDSFGNFSSNPNTSIKDEAFLNDSRNRGEIENEQSHDKQDVVVAQKDERHSDVKFDRSRESLDDSKPRKFTENREYRKSVYRSGGSVGAERSDSMSEPSRTLHRNHDSFKMRRERYDYRHAPYDYNQVDDRRGPDTDRKYSSRESEAKGDPRRGARTGSGFEKFSRWGHDMFEDNNRSPSPPPKDEVIEKIEALLSS